MNRLDQSLRFLVSGVVALVLVGCSGEQRPTVETEYVEGIVTLDGKPVAGATVTFVPVNKGQGMSATGRTDEQGKYTLTAVGGPGGVAGEPGAGTVPGEYYVGVVKTESSGEEIQEEQDGQEVEESGPKPEEPTIKHIVPQKYNNPRESGIKVTVKKGKNVIPIELSSK
ncbi:MAG: DUF4198 domain-containing protein [Planctomycetes bacterium]|nr:DUF4198 domain-containing protein [Planctomycetota bacterium]